MYQPMAQKHKQSFRQTLNPIANVLFDFQEQITDQPLVVFKNTTIVQPTVRIKTQHTPSPYTVSITTSEPVEDIFEIRPNSFSTIRPIIEDDNCNAPSPLQITTEELLAENFVSLPDVSAENIEPVVHEIIDRISREDFLNSIIEAADNIESDYSEEDALPTIEDVAEPYFVQTVQPNTIGEPTIKKAKKHLFKLRGVTRATAIFTVFALAVVMPIQVVSFVSGAWKAKAEIENTSADAITSFKNAAAFASTQDFNNAKTTLLKASASFESASETLQAVNHNLLGIAELLPNAGQDLKNARRILEAGEAASGAASTLANGLQTVSERASGGTASALLLFNVFVENALPKLNDADKSLSKVRVSSLPTKYQDIVVALQKEVRNSNQTLTAFNKAAPRLASLLGKENSQRYLILFQNNTELRPTGGFWGSMAEVDLLDGNIQRMKVPGGGTYSMQGQLTANVMSPEPLRLVRGRWELQDANWFPDFPTSAKKAMWFYEKSGGPTADGVMAVNATLASKLIDALGPLTLDSGKIIDGENFLFETQKAVETDYDHKENAPKKIIGELLSALLARIENAKGEDMINIASILAEGLNSRDIQMYHRDPDIQSTLDTLRWSGRILGTDGDFISVVHTNVGGGKTDGVIEDAIDISSKMNENGRIENTVTVKRTHHGISTSMFSGKNNVSFTRIFVPRESELLKIDGATVPPLSAFEDTTGLDNDKDLALLEKNTLLEDGSITQDTLGKTSFGAWIQTKPGTTSALTFKYLLPKDIINEKMTAWDEIKSVMGLPNLVSHSILVQAQSGVAARTTHYKFTPGDSLTSVSSTDKTLNSFILSENTDGYFGMVFEKK